MRKSIFPVAVLATLILSPLRADSPDPTIREPGASAPQARAIQGVTGGVPVNISGTISASTSCHATALAPTYIEGADDPLSCDLSGTLRTAAGGGGGSSDVAIHDNTTPTRHLTVDASGQIGVNNFPASQAVTGTFWQATQPVSGTFWQATQPVSGPLTDTQLRATAVPVSGTFWQATQPISSTQLPAALDGLNLKVHEQGTVPVTGTFWQATQPVSGTFWQATQPVSGTFWQATQPVSGTVAVTQSTSPWVDSLPDIAATGTIAANAQAVPITLSGNKSSCTVMFTGTWTGTIQFQALGRTGTFFQVSGFGPFSGLPFSQTTANANFTFTVGSYTQIEAVATAWTSGTATVDWNCGSGPLGNMFSISRIQDGTSNGLVASVLANDTTAALNGLESMPAVSKAAPAATTAGRGEFQQQDNVSGGIYTTESATSNNVALLQKVVSVNTTTNIKASAGNVYGASCANANASICFLQFYNTAGAPTCGTSVIWSLAIPTSGVLNMVSTPPMANHATGIGVCMGTTATGATACTAANACTIFYK